MGEKVKEKRRREKIKGEWKKGKEKGEGKGKEGVPPVSTLRSASVTWRPHRLGAIPVTRSTVSKH